MSYPQIHSEDMIWLPRCNCFTLYARFIEIRGTVVCFYNNSRAYWMIIGHNSTIYLTYLDHREWLVGFGRRGLFTTFIEHYRTLITVTLRVTLSHTRLWQSCVPKWAVAREKGICNSQKRTLIILQLTHFFQLIDWLDFSTFGNPWEPTVRPRARHATRRCIRKAGT